LRHAQELIPGDLAQRDRMTREVETFLAEAEMKMHEHELRDVYITNHKAKAAKFVTLNADEDIEYYNYVRSLEEYNSQPIRSERVS